MSNETDRPLTIEELERWVMFGARWRPVRIADELALVDLCQCTDELVERRRATDRGVIDYIRANAPHLD